SERIEQGAGRLGQGVMGTAELAASGAGLARLAVPALAVKAASTASLAAVRRRATALVRRRAAARGGGYTGHGSLLDVEDGRLPSLHQEGSFFATPPQNGQKSR